MSGIAKRVTYGFHIALVAATIVKILLVVFSSPIFGYANNYDFIRQSSCTGVWQDFGEVKPPSSSNPEAPVNNLVRSGVYVPEGCIFSIDNIFSSLVALNHKVGSKVDFREISALKIALTLLLFGLTYFFSLSQLNRNLLVVAFALTFSDFSVLLYLNTLYVDYSAIIGLFFSIFCTLFILSTKRSNTGLLVTSFLSLGVLGFSKQQYVPVAVLLAAVIGLTMAYRKNILGAVSAGSLSLVLALGLGAANPESRPVVASVSAANATNTFLWAVLPEATDKIKALDSLGLPKSCAASIGYNWWTKGVQENHPCPEVQKLGREKLAALFITQPKTLINPVIRAASETSPFYPSYLGVTEKKSKESLRALDSFKYSSLSTYVEKFIGENDGWLPFSSLITLTVVFVLGWNQKRKKNSLERAKAPLALIAAGGLLVIYSIFSSVFGDGYTEMPKHALGLLLTFSLTTTGSLFYVLAIAQDWSNSKFLSKC